MTTEIQKAQPAEIVKNEQPLATTPMEMIAYAQRQGATIEQMEQLLQLNRDMKADIAREEYNNAFASLKSESIFLKKDGIVGYKTKSGDLVGYSFLTLANMVDTVVPLMSKYGLSHSWIPGQLDGGISITCKVSHRLGHSESVTMSGPYDNSGKKNQLQSIGSAQAFLERYTFAAIMGLAASNQDDDAQKSSTKPIEYVSEEQAANIDALLSEINLEAEKFLAWEGALTIEEIPAERYDRAMKKLVATRDKK